MNPLATAKALRVLATRKDAARHIAEASAFTLAGRRYPIPEGSPPDRCVPMAGRSTIPPEPLSAMELIDDACDFERIADKAEKIRR